METKISNRTQIPSLPKVPPGEDSVHEIVVPSRLYDTRKALPQWRSFADYFEKHEGFAPTPGDARVEMLYNYYLIGAWDFESGRHNAQMTNSHENSPK